MPNPRELYSDVWTTVSAYGEHSPGEQNVPIFLDMIGQHLNNGVPVPNAWTPADYTVLDAGCGSGKGGLALQKLGFQVALCDVTGEGLLPGMLDYFPFADTLLWEDLSPVAYLAKAWADNASNPTVPFHFNGQKFDFVYCCDVMEHIPIALTMLVVRRLLDVTKQAAFFTISFQPDVMGYYVGKPLHETVMPFQWWRDQLALVGHVFEARDMLNSGAFLVGPR